MSVNLQPGATLGIYQLVSELAHGGMATIYRAMQPSLGRFVALKVLSAELSRDPDFVDRFQREARVAARLEHPNIVPIYDVGQAEGIFYIAMRLVPGRSLHEIISADGALPLERVRAILTQVAAALDYAHRQGVVHRDIKPSNVLVESGDQVSLADFGIARATEFSQITRFGVLVGTPKFMAPEQALGLDVDFRADLYSLGVVAYLMVTGQVPFDADSAVTLLHKHVYEPPPSARLSRPGLPESVDRALNRMLAKQPGERYPTAAAFVTALYEQPAPEFTIVRRPDELAAPQPVAPDGASLPNTPLPQPAGIPLWVIAAGCLAILLLVGVVWLTLHDRPPTPVPTPDATSLPTASTAQGQPVSTEVPVTPVGLQLPALRNAPTPTPSAPRQLSGTWEIMAGNPTVAGIFNGPTGVAVDQQGNIYITEQFNHRIQKLSPSGQSVAQWGTFGDGPGQFRDPAGITVDSSGNLYVADRGNNRIQKLAPDGTALTQWGGAGQLNGPSAVALDAQGNVYVADSGNNRIQKFSATGQALQQWGVFGEGPGQFTQPTGIAVDAQGMLYVVDQDNDRIQKLAPDGSPVAQWGTGPASGDDSSQLTFSGPTSLVLDAAGDMLVADSGNNRIVKVSPTGDQLADWGDWGDGPGDFESPLGIALDAQGNIFVTDHDSDRVQKLSSDGKPLTQWGSERTPPEEFRQPTGIAVDKQGNVYVADKNNQRIQKLSNTGDRLAVWGAQGTDPGQFSVPVGVAVDTQDNLLVTDSSNTRVQRFSLDGKLLAFWGTSGQAPGQLEGPAGIAVDQQGNLYVVDSDSNRVEEFSSSGQPITEWGKLGRNPGEFLTPVGIAIGPDGSVYVSDQGNSRIEKFSSSGQFMKQWGMNGSDHGQFQQVAGLAVDAQGNVLAADAGNNRIYQFSPDGQLLAESGTRGMAAGQFQAPAGIVVDATGAIYVTELYNHRVQRLRP